MRRMLLKISLLRNRLDTHDLTLDTFGQPELEHWLDDPAGGYRYETTTFLR